MDTLIPSSADLAGDPAVVSRAEAMRPIVEAASDEIEEKRRLPPALLDKLHEARLFRLLLPRSFDGFETDPITFFHVIEAISKGDASTAWCLSQAGGCAMSAAYLDPAVAREIFGDDPRAVLAWARARASGRSNARAATRSPACGPLPRAAVMRPGSAPPARSGRPTARRGSDRGGSQLERTMLVRASEVEWTDIWNVVGLRGTASDQFALTDHFVPAGHSITRDVITGNPRTNAARAARSIACRR